MNGPDGKRFPWGRITQVHSIGPYDIVEAVWNSGSDKGKTAFFVYVGKKDASQSADSLDGALALAIAYRREGPNSHAATYFMRMLKP